MREATLGTGTTVRPTDQEGRGRPVHRLFAYTSVAFTHYILYFAFLYYFLIRYEYTIYSCFDLAVATLSFAFGFIGCFLCRFQQACWPITVRPTQAEEHTQPARKVRWLRTFPCVIPHRRPTAVRKSGPSPPRYKCSQHGIQPLTAPSQSYPPSHNLQNVAQCSRSFPR